MPQQHGFSRAQPYFPTCGQHSSALGRSHRWLNVSSGLVHLRRGGVGKGPLEVETRSRGGLVACSSRESWADTAL